MKVMYDGIAFSPEALLTQDIGETDTVIYIDNPAAFPDGPNLATIGIDEEAETIKYAAKTENSLSGCERGVEGTAKVWLTGEHISRNFTAVDANNMKANIEAVAVQAEQTAALTNEVQQYKSLAELSATESTALITVFTAMATPSRLVCDIKAGSTNVYPAAAGVLMITKTSADTGTATFVYEDGRIATASFTGSSSSRGVNQSEWNRLTDRIASVCNPNLLINPDFKINQRGQTEYASAGYCVDRWSNSDANTVVTVVDNGVRIRNTGREVSWLSQATEIKSVDLNKPYTVSVKVDGKVYINSGNAKNLFVDIKDKLNVFVSLSKAFVGFSFSIHSGADFVLEHVKLELGEFSTLANEIVDHAAELRKCQRYLQVIPAYNTFRADYIDSTGMKFNLPVANMRTNPSVSGSYAICGIDNNAQSGFNVSAYTTGNMVVVSANKNGHGTPDGIFATGNEGVILSAEL